jgi:hypothetical protein
MNMTRSVTIALVLSYASMVAACVALGDTGRCDDACLTKIGDRYRAAYIKHDRAQGLFAQRVRFTENNVELSFPDGSWDVVTAEVGPPLTFTDPATGGIGIYTAVMMREVPAFLAIRLKVRGGEITEIEHLLSTKRAVSGPPTPFGDVTHLVHDPELSRLLDAPEKRSRAQLISLADGYFATMAHFTRCFHPAVIASKTAWRPRRTAAMWLFAWGSITSTSGCGGSRCWWTRRGDW